MVDEGNDLRVAVAATSPTGVQQDGLVKDLAATDIQSVFRGFRRRSRWRSLRGIRGSVRDLAASTVQSVVKAFLRRRSATATTKPYKQTTEVRELAVLCLQAVYRGHRTRKRTRTLTASDVDCGFTASSSSQASLVATSSVEELLRYSQSEPGGEEEATQASQAEAASKEAEEREDSSVDIHHPAALQDDAQGSGDLGPYWDRLGGGTAADEEPEGIVMQGVVVEEEEEEALSLALSINGPANQDHVRHLQAAASEGEAPPSPRLAASVCVSEDGTSGSLLRNLAGFRMSATSPDYAAPPATDPVLPGPLTIGPPCAGAGASKPSGNANTPGSGGWARGANKSGRGVLLVKMARERKHAVQAAYRHACEAVCQAVSLREAELRIVLHGIQLPLPPQSSQANTPKADEEEARHAENAAGYSAKGDGGSEPIFFLPLSTMTATAEALRTACVRLGLGRALAQGVTNKKADVARRQLLKIIKGAGTVQRLMLETWGQGNSTPISDWTYETVIRLLEKLEVPAKALASPILLRGGPVLLMAHNELAAELSIKSTMLRKRLELFQHALRGVDMWEGSGLWPGTLPASPLPPTRLSSHRRLARSLSSTQPPPLPETEEPGQHRRAATLPSPPRPSGFVGPEETAEHEDMDTWQPAPMTLPPLSSDGLERMNLATVKKGNHCIVAPTEELCRVFCAAWRAHGFGERVPSSDDGGQVQGDGLWLQDVLSGLVARQVGGRGARVLSLRTALPSHSFVRVEVYRPMDTFSSTWVLSETNGDTDTRGPHVDVVDLPLRALFHAPAAVVRPHVYTPHVLRVGRRVRVCEVGRLRECLDRAHEWVDSDAVYHDILALAGQHAEVICVLEACPPLCRVGLRTATGLEDAVPLCALEPLPPFPRRGKGHKRRRTPTTVATPCLPSPRPSRPPHARRHSTGQASPNHPSPHPSPARHSSPIPNNRGAHRLRTASLPSPPRVHVESSGSVTLAGSRLVPTPPPSPPPLAFPAIPSHLSRLPQRAPPSADLLDLVDAIDSFAPHHTYPPHLEYGQPHAYESGSHEESGYKAADESGSRQAYDRGLETSCPVTADEDAPAIAAMAVEVRQRQRSREEEKAEEAVRASDRSVRDHGTRGSTTTREERIRRRSAEAASLPQHCHRRTASGPPHGATLHKPALALSPVKLTFPTPTPSPCPPSSTPFGPPHRPAPSLTMNKAPLASKPRPASATRSRRASWGGSSTSPGHSRKPSTSSSHGAHAQAPRPRSATYTRVAHEGVDASYMGVAPEEEEEEEEGHEPGSLPWRSTGAAGDGQADSPFGAMGQGRGGSNNDDDCRDADERASGVPPPGGTDAEKGDGGEQEGTLWSSRWTKLRARPIARPAPQAPPGLSNATKADGGGTTDRGRRLRDGKAFVRRRRSSGGQQQAAAAAVGLVGQVAVATLADLEELQPPPRRPEVDALGGEAERGGGQQFMRPRGEPTPTTTGDRRRRSVTDVGDLQLDDGRRKSLEAKLRSIERQSQARMAKIHKVVERLRATTLVAGL